MSHSNWGASLALDFTFSQFCAEAGGRLHSHDCTQAVNMVFRFIIQSDLCGRACSVWKTYPSCFKLFFLLFLTDFFSQDFTLSPAFGDSLYVIWAADHFPSCSHKHIMVKELHLFPMQHYLLLKQKHLLVSVSSRKKKLLCNVLISNRGEEIPWFSTHFKLQQFGCVTFKWCSSSAVAAV